jgi:putative N6-adenine-specific DNA methylase
LDTYFAVTAPGLETFAAQELFRLFPVPESIIALERINHEEPKNVKLLKDDQEQLPVLPGYMVKSEPGGVSFKGGLEALYRANLYLRIPSRILARLGNFFYATSFPELQKRASRLPWERFMTPGQSICMHVTCHQSKLYHSDAVAKSIMAGMEERLGQTSPLVKMDEQTDGHPTQLVIVRLLDDRCSISVDSSGDLLHKRGYRQAVAKAPLRETLAAALVMASGWDKVSPLLDPFCGSGTIPIEAAQMALDIPAGLNRSFAFMDWPGYDQDIFNSQRSESGRLLTTPPILASDRDAGAVKMARENARRAGVEDFIEFKCQAVSSIQPPAQPGWVVTNPPYGLRISAGKDLRNLYAQFGNVLRLHCRGWNLSVLCNDAVLLGQMHLNLDTTIGFVNGGIGVRVGRGRVG